MAFRRNCSSHSKSLILRAATATNQKVGSSNLSGRTILQGFQRFSSRNSLAVLPVCYPELGTLRDIDPPGRRAWGDRIEVV